RQRGGRGSEGAWFPVRCCQSSRSDRSSTLKRYITSARRRSTAKAREPTGDREKRLGERPRFQHRVHRALTAERRAQLRRGQNLNRSEEHTSELQSLTNLVCRLLL